MTQYYTLTRDQIQAIAARAAELAVEQALDGFKPSPSPKSCRMADDPDAPQLTSWERNTISALFRK